MQKKKILIVEDDVFIRDIYGVKFSQEGFEVLIAEDGIIAIENLQRGFLPDIVLLDIMMPRMGGIEVLRKIKSNQQWKEIPVVMLTNISEKEKVSEGEKMGISGYLIKAQFTPSEVVQKVNDLLDEQNLL